MSISAVATPVFGSCFDPSENPRSNVPVVATLIGPTITTGGSVTREVKTYTDILGSWTLSLLTNSLFDPDPSVSYYLVRIGGKESYNINVPAVTYDSNNNPVPLDFLSLIENSTVATVVSALTGNMTIEGNLVVQGTVTVSGTLTCGSIVVEPQIRPGQVPTFFNNLNVIGNLTVTGTLTYLG